MLALREFDGAMHFLGVYVQEDGPGEAPTAYFGDEFDQVDGETLIASHNPANLAWSEAMLALAERANDLTVVRQGPFETEHSAEELFRVTAAALASGTAVNALPA